MRVIAFLKDSWKRSRERVSAAARSLTVYLEALTGEELVPAIIAAVQTFGERIKFHPAFICY